MDGVPDLRGQNNNFLRHREEMMEKDVIRRSSFYLDLILIDRRMVFRKHLVSLKS